MMNALQSPQIATNPPTIAVPEAKGIDVADPSAFLSLLDQAGGLSSPPALPAVSPVAVSSGAALQTPAEAAGSPLMVPLWPETDEDSQLNALLPFEAGLIAESLDTALLSANAAPASDVTVDQEAGHASFVAPIPLVGELRKTSSHANSHAKVAVARIPVAEPSSWGAPSLSPRIDIPHAPHRGDTAAREVDMVAPRESQRMATAVWSDAMTVGPLSLPAPLQAVLSVESATLPDEAANSSPDGAGEPLASFALAFASGPAAPMRAVAEDHAIAGPQVTEPGALRQGAHSDMPAPPVEDGKSHAPADRRPTGMSGADTSASKPAVSALVGHEAALPSAHARPEMPAMSDDEPRVDDNDPPGAETFVGLAATSHERSPHGTRPEARIDAWRAGFSRAPQPARHAEPVSSGGDPFENRRVSGAEPSWAASPPPIERFSSTQSPGSPPLQQSQRTDQTTPLRNTEPPRPTTESALAISPASGVVEVPAPAGVLPMADSGRDEPLPAAISVPATISVTVAHETKMSGLPRPDGELRRPDQKVVVVSRDMPEMPIEHPQGQAAPLRESAAAKLADRPATMLQNDGGPRPATRERAVVDAWVRSHSPPVRMTSAQSHEPLPATLSAAEALSRFRQMLDDAGPEQPSLPTNRGNSVAARLSPLPETRSGWVPSRPVPPMEAPVPQRPPGREVPGPVVAQPQQRQEAAAIPDFPEMSVEGLHVASARTVPAPVGAQRPLQESATPSAPDPLRDEPRSPLPDQRAAEPSMAGRPGAGLQRSGATGDSRALEPEKQVPVVPVPVMGPQGSFPHADGRISHPDAKPADHSQRDGVPVAGAQASATEITGLHAGQPFKGQQHVPVEVPVQPVSAAVPVTQPIDRAEETSAAPGQFTLSAQHSPFPVPAGPASVSPAAKSADILSRSLPKRTSASLVQSVATRGRSRAEVVLEPAELGRVRFDIATHGDTVQVTLLVERPETLDLLRRHVEELRQEFRAAGFDTGSLSFGQWGQRGEGRASPDLAGSEVFADEAMELAPVTAPPQPPRPSLGAGLDLRL